MCEGSKTGDAGDAPTIDPAAPLEAASGPGEEDEFDIIEGYDTRSTGSTSATSSIYAHTYEHGRRYHHFKNGRYPIPNDNEEQNREDMKHTMLLELMDGQLFYAPIGDNPQQILDVGTGTGEKPCALVMSIANVCGLTWHRHCTGIWAIDGLFYPLTMNHPRASLTVC